MQYPEFFHEYAKPLYQQLTRSGVLTAKKWVEDPKDDDKSLRGPLLTLKLNGGEFMTTTISQQLYEGTQSRRNLMGAAMLVYDPAKLYRWLAVIYKGKQMPTLAQFAQQSGYQPTLAQRHEFDSIIEEELDRLCIYWVDFEKAKRNVESRALSGSKNAPQLPLAIAQHNEAEARGFSSWQTLASLTNPLGS